MPSNRLLIVIVGFAFDSLRMARNANDAVSAAVFLAIDCVSNYRCQMFDRKRMANVSDNTCLADYERSRIIRLVQELDRYVIRFQHVNRNVTNVFKGMPAQLWISPTGHQYRNFQGHLFRFQVVFQRQARSADWREKQKDTTFSDTTIDAHLRTREHFAH